MEIKLVALDLDGTLLNSRKELPAEFIEWVKTHTEIKTVIASGRQYYTIVRDFLPIKDRLVYAADNGGLVFEGDTVIYKNELEEKDVCRCLERMDDVDGVIPIVCGEKSAYIKERKNVRQEIKMYYERLQMVDDLYEIPKKDSVIKFAVFVEGERAEQVMLEFADMGENLTAVLSGDSWIDISSPSVSKGNAVAVIQKKYGIDRKESMAFGDYLNDVSLFENCEESYCMENGHPALKKLAKYVADSNDNNGVMKILQRL